MGRLDARTAMQPEPEVPCAVLCVSVPRWFESSPLSQNRERLYSGRTELVCRDLRTRHFNTRFAGIRLVMGDGGRVSRLEFSV